MLNSIKLILMLVMVISLVGAVPPVTSEFVGDTNLVIEANVMPYYKVNEGAQVHIWVFNKTNGAVLSSPAVSCAVELADHNGTIVLSGYPTPHENHFQMSRPANIVNSAGIYGMTLVCNNSDVAGFKTAFFEANKLGKNLSEDAIIDAIALLLFFGIAIFFLIFARTTEEAGIKLFFNVIGYVMLFYSIGGSYIMLQLSGSGLENLSKGMLITIAIIFIVIMYYIFINLTKISLAMFRAKKGFGSELDNPATF